MIKTKLLMVFGFFVAFGAGTVVGLFSRRLEVAVPAGVVAPEPPRRSRLAQELGLSKEQDEQIKKIWQALEQEFRVAERESEGRRAALRKEKEESILALVGPERKADYEKMIQEYYRKMGELMMGADRRRRFEKAIEQTKQVLDEPQRAKYEEILKRRGGEGRGHGPQHRRPETQGSTRSGSRASTQPAAG